MYKLDFINGRLMIIDLHLNGKTVVIVGAGTEALKRIKLLENEECQIIVIGEKPNFEISKLSKTKKITLKKTKLTSSLFLKKYKPFLVIASTTDQILNRKKVKTAKIKKIQA